MSETYSRVRVGKNLSDMFHIKNGLKEGDVLTPLLFNFVLEYAIRMVQVKKDGLKLNGTHRLLVNADHANILGGNARALKKSTEALVVVSKETGLEVKADKTKSMVRLQEEVTIWRLIMVPLKGRKN